MYFTATFEPHGDGSGRYDVTFCDLPGCISQGENLDDAMRMARSAVAHHVGAMLKSGEALPQPSTPDEARQKDSASAREDGYDLSDGTIWQYVHFDPKPIEVRRKTPPLRKFQGCRLKNRTDGPCQEDK